MLEDCNWGECLTVDDGLPIEADDDDEPELDKSVLFVISSWLVFSDLS